MTTLSKFLLATTIAIAANSVFAKETWEFKPHMAYVYAGPGKMSAMEMAVSDKNHKAMMEHATRVPDNTIFFMTMACSTPPRVRSTQPAISISRDASSGLLADRGWSFPLGPPPKL